MSRLRKLFGGFRPHGGESGPQDGDRWLIVGLGNPGNDYSKSLHNLGFLAIDRLTALTGIALERHKFKVDYGDGKFEGQSLLLAKPQTFMNLNGPAVNSLKGYYRISTTRLIVLYDELDLERGRLQVRRGGGDAGHNGIRSLLGALDSPDFIRIRIGIGKPPNEEKGRDYLLRPLKIRELDEFTLAVERAAEAVLGILRVGLEKAMTQFNQRRPTNC